MSQKKKGAVYGVITLMLCFAVYLNWSFSRSGNELQVAGQVQEELTAGKIYGSVQTVDGVIDTEGASVVSTDDYFAEARLTRQTARDSAVSILQQTIDNENATEEAKTEASQQVSALADQSVKEAQAENLIKAKGYDEVVVFLNDAGANVVVSAPEEGFSAADASRIRDILMSELGVSADQISIIDVELT